jgi:hypothetical protein
LRRKREWEYDEEGMEAMSAAMTPSGSNIAEALLNDRLPGAWPGSDPATTTTESETPGPARYVDGDGYRRHTVGGLDDDGIFLHIEEDFVDANGDQHIKESVRSGSKVGELSGWGVGMAMI